jgi:hypothetical protein
MIPARSVLVPLYASCEAAPSTDLAQAGVSSPQEAALGGDGVPVGGRRLPRKT